MRSSRFLVMFPLVLCTSAFSSEARTSFNAIPVVIEKNQGQAPSDVRYLTRYGGLEALFTSRGVEFLNSSEGSTRVSLRVVGGAANIEPVGGSPLKSHSNYFIGNDSRQWVTEVENEREVTYPAVYPGIDLVFHGLGGELEHDFRVAPGRDPKTIAFRFEGTAAPALDANGDLKIALGTGTMIVRRPVAYQETGSNRSPVNARFALDLDGTVRFDVGPYGRA